MSFIVEQILAVEQYLASGRSVKLAKQIQQSGLTRARKSDKGNGLTCWNCHIHIPKCLRPVGINEIDVSEFKFTLKPIGFQLAAFLDRVICVENFKKAF